MADAETEQLELLAEGDHLLQLFVLELQADALHVDLDCRFWCAEVLLLELQQLRFEIYQDYVRAEFLIFIDHILQSLLYLRFRQLLRIGHLRLPTPIDPQILHLEGLPQGLLPKLLPTPINILLHPIFIHRCNSHPLQSHPECILLLLGVFEPEVDVGDLNLEVVDDFQDEFGGEGIAGLLIALEALGALGVFAEHFCAEGFELVLPALDNTLVLDNPLFLRNVAENSIDTIELDLGGAGGQALPRDPQAEVTDVAVFHGDGEP